MYIKYILIPRNIRGWNVQIQSMTKLSTWVVLLLCRDDFFSLSTIAITIVSFLYGTENAIKMRHSL